MRLIKLFLLIGVCFVAMGCGCDHETNNKIHSITHTSYEATVKQCNCGEVISVEVQRKTKDPNTLIVMSIDDFITETIASDTFYKTYNDLTEGQHTISFECAQKIEGGGLKIELDSKNSSTFYVN